MFFYTGRVIEQKQKLFIPIIVIQEFYIWQSFQSLESSVKIFFKFKIRGQSLKDLKAE